MYLRDPNEKCLPFKSLCWQYFFDAALVNILNVIAQLAANDKSFGIDSQFVRTVIANEYDSGAVSGRHGGRQAET